MGTQGLPSAEDFRPVATREDILACFRLLLGRYPSEAEWVGHSGLAGAPLQELVAGYLHSLEFRQRGLMNAPSTLEIIDLPRFRMYVTSDDPLIGHTIRNARIYEPDVTQVFVDHLRPRANVLDIGANIGYFSLLAASLIGPEGTVFAFEPLASNVKVLAANRMLNRFNNIEIIAGAASDRVQTLAIGAAYTDGVVGDIPQSVEGTLGCEFVITVPADIVVHTKIDLLKIDVEGHEYRVISGAKETIRRSRPLIVTEFSPGALEANSRVPPVHYLDLLRSFGYRLSPVGQPGKTTNEEILELTRRVDHIDILAEP